MSVGSFSVCQKNNFDQGLLIRDSEIATIFNYYYTSIIGPLIYNISEIMDGNNLEMCQNCNIQFIVSFASEKSTLNEA